jgi:transcription antitermination factor NusG
MINFDPTEKHWYALYTKPRHEFKAELQISALDVELYLPSTMQVRQWSDRKKTVRVALLGGYLFIHADERERLKALEAPSVVRCIFDRGRPAVIPDNQIENLRNFIKEDKRYSIYNGIVKGTKIKIKEGPFQGVTGVVAEDSDGKSLAVTIDLLNRSVLTYISDNDIVEVLRETESPQ